MFLGLSFGFAVYHGQLPRYVFAFAHLPIVSADWCLGVPCHPVLGSLLFSKNQEKGFICMVPAFQGGHGYLLGAYGLGTLLTFKAPVPKLIYL